MTSDIPKSDIFLFLSFGSQTREEAKNRTLAIALVSSIILMIITDVVVGRQTFSCLELKKEWKRKLISSV